MKEFELDHSVDAMRMLVSNGRSDTTVKPQAIAVPVAAVPVAVVAVAAAALGVGAWVAAAYSVAVYNKIKLW